MNHLELAKIKPLKRKIKCKKTKKEKSKKEKQKKEFMKFLNAFENFNELFISVFLTIK